VYVLKREGKLKIKSRTRAKAPSPSQHSSKRKKSSGPEGAGTVSWEEGKGKRPEFENV